MGSQSDEEPSMMEEALKILNEEGFTLPQDVISTLTTASRGNPRSRPRGCLRGHRVCEVQSNTRRMRNERETSGRRGSGAESRSFDSNDGDCDDNDGVAAKMSEMQSSAAEQNSTGFTNNVQNGAMRNGAAGTNGKSQNGQDNEESSESGSTCSASTVRELHHIAQGQSRGQFDRQDSNSSIASSASSFNRKLKQADSSGCDTGYNTSIENALQTHEARAENLKNINKHIENKMSEKMSTGLRRDISRDSGFTEATVDTTCSSPVRNTVMSSSAVNDSTKNYRDTAMSTSDQKEQTISTDSGDAYVVTSSASDMSAAEMTSRGNERTADGTMVSSAAKLADQESNSALSRTTFKNTGDEMSKQDEYELENRTTKSSRNDSISTAASGVVTAASRHAQSMEQDLAQEVSKITLAADNRSVTTDLSGSQQLTRNQEVNNIEQASDGSSKEDHKQISEKSLMTKAHTETQKKSADGKLDSSIAASQELQADTKSSQNEETLTQADGTVSKKRRDSTSSSVSEKSTTEKKTASKYGGSSSTGLTKKALSSSISKSSSSVNESKDTHLGRLESSKLEDSSSVSSNQSGQCESTEVVNGRKVHRTMSSESSSENKVKSTKSNYSYSGSDGGRSSEIFPSRRFSNTSNASTLSNTSGLSKDHVSPPTYEETVNNLSRQNSRSSVFSRQDSSASSIASSASAQNERQRQKLLMAERNRTPSVDSITRVKEVANTAYDRRNQDYARQDSRSSGSTISGRDTTDPIYQNVGGDDFFADVVPRRRMQPTNKPQFYSRSQTDPVHDTRPNRRATLHGDVITEREMMEAREEVKSTLRGRDDSYMYGNNRSTNKPRSSGGVDTFKQEMMEIVDSFFDDDDDDDFGFGFSSRRKRGTRNDDDFGRRTTPLHSNPYTTRDDLSRVISREGSHDSNRITRSGSDYPASDSGHPSARGNRSRLDDVNPRSSASVFSDSASDTAHTRRSRNITDNVYSRFDSRDAVFGTEPLDLFSSTRRGNYHNSNSVTGVNTSISSIDDSSQRVGRSIRGGGGGRDCEISTSILGGNRRTENEARQLKYNNCRNINEDYNSYADDTSSRCESDFDMSDAGSSYTCDSTKSLPPKTFLKNRGAATNSEDFVTRSLPDLPKVAGTCSEDKGGRFEAAGDQPPWENRRERIDNALAWIRTELGSLRTQDKVLMSQFQRCQDSIEQLKKQRPWYEVFSDEEMDDSRHWEDWEIDDFDRACQNERRELGFRQNSDPRSGAFQNERLELGSRQNSDPRSGGTMISQEYQRLSMTKRD